MIALRAEDGAASPLAARNARLDLQRRLERLGRHVASCRLSYFRSYVGTVVETASPLLLRLCVRQRLDLDALVERMGPDGAWPVWLCGARPRDPRRRAKGWPFGGPAPTAVEAAHLDLQWFAHSGLVVMGQGDDLPFGIRVLGSGLEFGAFLGDCRIRTHGATGSISIPHGLPATVTAALPGRCLDDLVRHPLLEGAGCVVERVREPNRWGTRVFFRLPPTPWRFPWARAAVHAA